MVEKRDYAGSIEFYLGNNGKITCRMLYGIDVVAKENVKLERKR